MFFLLRQGPLRETLLGLISATLLRTVTSQRPLPLDGAGAIKLDAPSIPQAMVTRNIPVIGRCGGYEDVSRVRGLLDDGGNVEDPKLTIVPRSAQGVLPLDGRLGRGKQGGGKLQGTQLRM